MTATRSVLDTCTLIWWTLSPSELSSEAARRCGTIAALGAWVCSASIWEIGLKIQNKQLVIGCSIEEYCRRLYTVNVQIEPIDERLWIKSLNLKWLHRDPVDRLIVSLAEQKEAPLITRDREIRSFYPGAVW